MAPQFFLPVFLMTLCFVDYGQAVIFVNPMKCLKSSERSTTCLISNLDDSETTSLSMQAMIPKDTLHLTIYCTTAANNNISTAAFQFLELPSLIFWNCRFPYFPSDGICFLKSLHSLVFFSLFDWKTFPLANYEMVNVEEPFICPLTNLTNFAVTGTGIENISQILPCSLSPLGCSKLQSLNLSTNEINIIAPGAFDGLTNLKVLDLSSNRLTSLPKDEIIKLKSLIRLLLSGNNFGKISTGVFFQNQFLSQIDIGYSENIMQTAPTELHVFSQTMGVVCDYSCEIYSRLEYEDNQLPVNYTSLPVCVENNSSFDDRILKNLKSLNNLSLTFTFSSSEFRKELPTFLKSVLTEMVQLTELSLTYSRQFFPKMFANIPLLQTLSLITNANFFNISTPDIFYGLHQLHVLDVRSWQFFPQPPRVHWQAGLFRGIPKLETLRVNHMGITSLSPNALENLNNLKVFELENTLLRSVPSCLCHRENASNLLDIRLKFSKILNLSTYDFHGCPNLSIIDLTGNEITSLCNIPSENAFCETFSSLTKLSYLHLSYNKIKTFDFSLIPCSLQYLDLSDNDISSLTDHNNIRHIMNLKILKLKNNQLYNFNSNTFPLSVTQISLGNYGIRGPNSVPSKPLHIDPSTFSSLNNLTVVSIRHEQNFEISRNSFLNSSSARKTPTYFDIELKEHLNYQSYDSCSVKENDINMSTHKINDLVVVSYYNNETLQHFYCHHNKAHVSEFQSNNSSTADCSQNTPLIVNILDCGSVGFQEFPLNFPSEFSPDHLILYGNNLNTIPSSAFVTLNKSLTVLYLNNSRISVIEENAFASQTDIRELHLENNELVEVMKCLLPLSANLKHLYLQNNRIITLDQIHYFNLQTMNLDNSLLVTFPENVTYAITWTSYDQSEISFQTK